MKKTLTGWIGKDDYQEILEDKNAFLEPGLTDLDGYLIVIKHHIFTNKGSKRDWCRLEWPPKKITLTIEIED